jgi:hypothetical protein
MTEDPVEHPAARVAAVALCLGLSASAGMADPALAPRILAKAQQELRAAEAVAVRPEDFRRDVAALDATLARLHRWLPESLDVEGFVAAVSKAAEASEMKVSSDRSEIEERKGYQQARVSLVLTGKPKAVDALRGSVEGGKRLVVWEGGSPANRGAAETRVTVRIFAAPGLPADPARGPCGDLDHGVTLLACLSNLLDGQPTVEEGPARDELTEVRKRLRELQAIVTLRDRFTRNKEAIDKRKALIAAITAESAVQP